MKKTLHISVRALVEYGLRSGDLGGGEFQGPHRAVEGTRIHRKIQKSRPAEYTSEIVIIHRCETDMFRIEIRGRIDGLYIYPDSIIIDEIKTVTKDLSVAGQHEQQQHWGQVKCYAYCYAVEHDLYEIDVQLTYCQLDTGEIQEFRRHFSRDELETFFRELLDRYLAWAETLETWYGIRDASIRALDFPFITYRSGQREMAVGVYRAIKHGRQLLVQAPTGIGKTMAALFPAIKAMAEGCTQKIFYLTARTTGRTAAEKALAELRARGLRLKALTLTAKEKICFCPENDCHGDVCEFARGYFDRLNPAIAETFQKDALTRETLEDAARKHTLCPFELSLDLSLWADCIICDYNYAFDPTVYLRRFFVEIHESYTFLADEAHNLVDRSREMFSAELRRQSFLDLRREVKGTLPELYKTLGKINSWLLTHRKRCEEEPDRRLSKEHDFRAEQSAPEEVYPLLRTFLDNAEQWLVRNIPAPFREDLLHLYFEVGQFLRTSEQYNEKYVTCFEKIDRDFRMKLFCLDPSRLLADALTRCRSAIFFSATLTPMEYFKDIFGCDESAGTFILPSPFPPEHLGLFIIDSISILYKAREHTKAAVARTLISLVRQKKGNYLLFFPSYRYMRMLMETFCEQQPEIDTVVQSPGMTEEERAQFLERFAHDNQQSLVGFAVMGGIFGEGIDLVGDRLTGTAVIGVGLPGISPERELIRNYFMQRDGTGFEYAYLYPGINRVLQAAGRVIRSETDRGVVLLIDQRFSTSRYTRLFPQEWNPVNVRNNAHIQKILQAFWEAQ